MLLETCWDNRGFISCIWKRRWNGTASVMMLWCNRSTNTAFRGCCPWIKTQVICGNFFQTNCFTWLCVFLCVWRRKQLHLKAESTRTRSLPFMILIRRNLHTSNRTSWMIVYAHFSSCSLVILQEAQGLSKVISAFIFRQQQQQRSKICDVISESRGRRVKVNDGKASLWSFTTCSKVIVIINTTTWTVIFEPHSVLSLTPNVLYL